MRKHPGSDSPDDDLAVLADLPDAIQIDDDAPLEANLERVGKQLLKDIADPLKRQAASLRDLAQALRCVALVHAMRTGGPEGKQDIPIEEIVRRLEHDDA